MRVTLMGDRMGSAAQPRAGCERINQFIDWSTYSLTSLFVSDSLTT
jgi:hypothetical protein